MRRPDCLLIDSSDFRGFPPGGPLSHSRQLIAAFGPRLALVGICTDDTAVGRWVERDLGGARLLFYGIGRRREGAARPLVPARIQQLVRLVRHRRGILSLGVRAAFVQAPEDLLAVSRWGLDTLCYQFHGVENPLAVLPRYGWGRLFAGWLDREVFEALARADVILASADERAIAGLVARSGGRLSRPRVTCFPTHYDSSVFIPGDRAAARRTLGWGPECRVAVAVGRINRVKGWDLVLDAFGPFRRAVPEARLQFVGDGEDRPLLEQRIAARGLERLVSVTGFLSPQAVALSLQAADVVVVGSHREGWSVAMLESLGCGKPIVATDVSGARELIREGENGFVVPSREPGDFAAAMVAALSLPRARDIGLAIASEYRLERLATRLGKLWPVLA